jgi:hypothetical protein
MSVARSMAGGRIAIGVAALVAPRLAARAFGFPTDHDNATARALGRLFGVRELVLGALVLHFENDPRVAGYIYRLQAGVDAGDATSLGVALVKREGIDRAALGTIVVALGAAAGWTGLARAQGASDPVA